MKLVGNLKKQVEATNSKEEAKELIENAGMQLTDDELDNVTGGNGGTNPYDELGYCQCSNGKPGPIGQICPVCHQAYVG